MAGGESGEDVTVTKLRGAPTRKRQSIQLAGAQATTQSTRRGARAVQPSEVPAHHRQTLSWGLTPHRERTPEPDVDATCKRATHVHVETWCWTCRHVDDQVPDERGESDEQRRALSFQARQSHISHTTTVPSPTVAAFSSTPIW